MENQAVGYVRCSTDMQDQSIDDQKSAIAKFAKDKNLKILRWYEDEDSSGTSIIRRKGFQNLKNLADQNKHDFSKILIYDVTRWGRFPDPRESIYWEVYFEKLGVTLIYIRENFQSDRPFESAIIKTIKHASAGEFSRKLSDLTTRGSKTTAQKGLWNGAPAPYGYKRAEVDPEGNVGEFLNKGEKCRPGYKVRLGKGDPEEIRVVQTIFDCYVNRGMGFKSIANMLNCEGVPSPHKGHVKCFKKPDDSWERKVNKGEWGITTVWRILTNRVYIGTLIWGKLKSGIFTRVENTWGDINNSKTIHDKDKWIVCENAHEALIEKEIFNKAQILRKSKNYFKKGGDGRTYGSTYLLTGLLVCSNCEHKFHGHTHQVDKVNGHYKRVYRYYEDGGFYYKGQNVCKSLHIRKEIVDDFVLSKIAERLNNPALFPILENRLRKELGSLSKGKNEDVEDVNTKINDIEGRINNLLDYIEEGKISQQIEQRLQKLQQEEQRLLSLKRRIEKQAATKTDINAVIDEFKSLLQDGTKILDIGTNEEKKLLIRKFVRDAVVERDKNEVRFSFFQFPSLIEDCALYTDRNLYVYVDSV